MGQQVTGARSSKWQVPPEIKNKFSKAELSLITAAFKDLALRSPGKTIDRTTFLRHFPLPGLHGERLFDVFDHKKTGVIDYEEFVTGFAVCCKGSFDEKAALVFQIYDISNDNSVCKEELRTMLLHVPSYALEALSAEAEEEDVKRRLLTAADEAEHALRSVDRLVDQAFDECDLDKSGRLSFEQFKTWVRKTPEVVDFLNSVFPFTNDTSNNVMSPRRSRLGNGGVASLGIPIMKLPNQASTSRQSTKSLAPISSSGEANNGNTGDGRSILSSSPRELQGLIELKRDQDEGLGSGDMSPLFRRSSSQRSTVGNTRTWDDVGKTEDDQVLSDDEEEEFDYSVVMREGSLSKLGRRTKRLQTRYYRLYGNILYYYSDKRASCPTGVILMAGCHVCPIPDNGFTILTGRGGERDERSFFAKAKEDRDGWVEALRYASHDRDFQKSYSWRNKLGKGKFSNVYLCQQRKTGELHAVKVIRKSSLSLEENHLLRTEIAILKLVRHPNIILLEDVYETIDHLYIVMELLEGGELYNRIVGRARFKESEAYWLVKQLVQGVDYLHKAGIVHRDIKPENILITKAAPKNAPIDENFHIKISDFGLSKLVGPREVMKLACGTLSYVAPEVLSRKGYGRAADLWSIGVILYLVLRGKLPFNATEKEDIINEILYRPLKWDSDPFWSTLSSGIVSVVRGLLCKDPTKRLTSKEVLEHPWMKDMNEKHVAEKQASLEQQQTELAETKKPETAQLNTFDENKNINNNNTEPENFVTPPDLMA